MLWVPASACHGFYWGGRRTLPSDLLGLEAVAEHGRQGDRPWEVQTRGSPALELPEAQDTLPYTCGVLCLVCAR